MPEDINTAGALPAVFRSAPSADGSGADAPRIGISRITARRDFLAANSGIRVPMPAFVLLVKPTAQGVARVGFTVSKKVGNAVARNRAKRRLREVARMALPELAVPSADHIFIARPQAAELPFDELLALTRKALGKAVRKLEEARKPEARP